MRIEIIKTDLLDFNDKIFVTRQNLDSGPLEDIFKNQPQLHPITVRAAKDGKYQIIAGWRRALALRTLSKTVVVNIVEVNDQEGHLLATSENLDRDNLNGYEVFSQVQKLIKSGYSRKDLEKQFRWGHSHVGGIASLDKFPSVVDALKDGRINSISTAYEIAGALSSNELGDNPKVVESLADKLSNGVVTVKGLSNFVSSQKKHPIPEKTLRKVEVRWVRPFNTENKSKTELLRIKKELQDAMNLIRRALAEGKFKTR